MKIEWSDFKSKLQTYRLAFVFHECNKYYELYMMFGEKELVCYLPRDIEYYASEVLDFETNFKASGNKPIGMQQLPFAAKMVGNKKLYKRVHGMQQAITAGSNTILFTIPYNWVKITGLEIIGGETLDYASIYVLDSTTGTYTTVPDYQLNQFGFSVNVAKDYYEHKSEFDADLYIGMQVKIVYNSISNKTIAINYILNELKD